MFLFFAVCTFVDGVDFLCDSFAERCSADAISGFQSFFLTVAVNCSVCAGSFSRASLKRLSAASSDSTMSSASSGHAWMHLGSPSQRLHAMALPVSALMAMPPCGQACTHQSQPLHFFSSMISKPVNFCLADCTFGACFYASGVVAATAG